MLLFCKLDYFSSFYSMNAVKFCYAIIQIHDLLLIKAIGLMKKNVYNTNHLGSINYAIPFKCPGRHTRDLNYAKSCL